ncbi:DUF222 domain-containing protein [Phycicoccus sp. M110.8]|uniref:HNH endonuclease signature motif containing protein n=1 Tax=Phycicoccus sp. M110.8 TaxID=3075433 RepID=UPI0028FD0BAF|nr:DUF222 domain-containing protein [Phycicoccus sp. M110.8]MDU0315224.1 DUF222 domain-containing protein [Phycicoccus sp. M110.8]
MSTADEGFAWRGATGPRPVLAATVAALEAMTSSSPERLWALGEGEVTAALQLLGRLSACVDAHLVSVLAEAKRRSLDKGEGWGPVDWARAVAPELPQRTVLAANTVAESADEPRLAEVVAAATVACGGDTASSLPVSKAAQLVRFHRSVRGLADPKQLDSLTDLLLDSARGHGGLSEGDLAVALRHTSNELRPDRLVEHEDDVRRAHRSMVKSRGPLGLSRYTLLLDDEGAAVVDAAVDALAKPSRDEETGELDLRSPATRRADALLDLVRRAVEAPDGVPRQAKTSLVVTIGLDVLSRRCRGAGLTFGDALLTTDTVRRLACDAEVVPVVLGSRGEVLDQGQAKRLFTPGQIRNLWLRDRRCTFPGCSKPARWTDAHHLVHWADGGATDVANAALLCRAHHTVVHRQRYAGSVVQGDHGPRVHWELVPGSYDDLVEAMRRRGLHLVPVEDPEPEPPGRDRPRP